MEEEQDKLIKEEESARKRKEEDDRTSLRLIRLQETRRPDPIPEPRTEYFEGEFTTMKKEFDDAIYVRPSSVHNQPDMSDSECLAYVWGRDTNISDGGNPRICKTFSGSWGWDVGDK